jgi:17beta-estradiol 17-dehydrogenase / very-long-chain 3-oxoacyl-CoA reductase
MRNKHFNIFLKVKTIALDFNRDDIYDKIETELNKLDLIDVLVNNVGTIHRMEYFTKIPVAYNKTYFNVNMLSYTKMIEIILPKMVQQKRGIIINISSQAGERPVPLMTTYAASNYIFGYFKCNNRNFKN